MAPESRRDPASLKELLFKSPGRFEFFQTVRLLRRLWPDRKAIGHDHDPDREVARFRSSVSLSFQGGDISSLAEPEGREPVHVGVAFMGVASPASFGALPRRYSQEILYQNRQKNGALGDFLDLFNHRFISLFYRAWERHRVAPLYESGDDNPFEHALYGLIGLGTPGLDRRMPLDDRSLFSRGGLLAMRPISASALAGVIRSVFGVEAEIQQFVPAWYSMEDDDQNRIGRSNTTLGEDFYLGVEIRLVQSKFRVRLGPLGFEQYVEFLPECDGFHALAKLVRFAVGADKDFEIQLLLPADQRPRLHLGRAPGPVCRLGWSTWLGTNGTPASGGAGYAVDDAVFDPEFEPAQYARDGLFGNPSATEAHA
jgi:type VI secretion system protein ImpH